MAGIRNFGKSVTFSGTAIPKTRSVSIGEASRDEIDVTTDQTSTDWREFIGGLIEGGTVTVGGLFDPDDTNPGLVDSDDGAAKTLVITFSDGGTATMQAVLLGGGVDASGIDGATEYSVSFKQAGPITFA